MLDSPARGYSIKDNARYLRKNLTDAERKLWLMLRNRRFYGYKFRRQYWIEKYIVDFICIEKNLIIELDGGQHIEQKEYDEKRARRLMDLNYRVIRFWNDQVLRDCDEVLGEIHRRLIQS